MDKAESNLIRKFLENLDKGNAFDAKQSLAEAIKLKIQNKHEKVSKEID